MQKTMHYPEISHITHLVWWVLTVAMISAIAPFTIHQFIGITSSSADLGKRESGTDITINSSTDDNKEHDKNEHMTSNKRHLAEWNKGNRFHYLKVNTGWFFCCVKLVTIF